MYLVLPKHLPQDTPGNTVDCLLQIHKAHVDWLGKLPCTLQNPGEGEELVQCSTTRAEPALLLLNPGFDYKPDSLLQYPCIDLTREAEECDSPVVGTHPPVPLFKKRHHHTSLPIQWHRPRCPRNVEKACQPRQPHNIQSLEELKTDLIHPWSLANKELFNYLSDFGLSNGQAYSHVPILCLLTGEHVGGIEKVLKVFLPPPNDIFSRSQQHTISTVYSASGTLLSPSESSDALPESFRSQLSHFQRPHQTPPTQVFALATTEAADRLACRYLPAASGVPQANHAWRREATEDQNAKAHAFGHCPIHKAPNPYYCPSHRWWVDRKGDSCNSFGLGPARHHE
ncbi:hypothetical protein SRHO_G00083500 [Serrasalmus rhombeus]